MLKVPTKIISGPELFNSLLGESEAKVQALFEQAHIDQEKYGLQSPLHVIVFDECKWKSMKNSMTRNSVHNENTSYSAMLNIREPVPHPESITTNSSESEITSTRYPTEFLPIPSNSGIPIYMDDRQAISLKHASNFGTEFRNCIETESVPAILEFFPIPRNSHRFRFYLIPELDEALTKFDSGVDGTDSECGTGSRMFNIAE
jgi:SpoVK/Ycf46/Vps4 family AAA+-type ATPase